MAWLVIEKNGDESIYSQCPERGAEYWESSIGNDSVFLPKGTINKLIGHDMTWDDEPIELTEELINVQKERTQWGNTEFEFDNYNFE